MPGPAVAGVDVIVPTYGKPELLAACLLALRRSTYAGYRLIVVDDASPSPALPIVTEHHPGALVLRAGRNGGLARAFNRGIAAGTAPLVALLNDDTEVTPGWLGSLVACAERHPEAGSIASKLLLQSDRRRFHSAGDGFGVWGMPLNRGVWLDDLGQYDCEEEVFGACAGGALYRRAALEAIRLPGGDIFDSRLWMYLEDVDLAWRLQLGGFTCVYAPAAVLHHHLSATAGGELASYFVSRNIWHILLHTMPRRLLRSSGRRKIAFHLGRVMRDARHARSPHARASLCGSLAGVGVAARALGPTRNRTGNYSRPDPEQVQRIERLLTRC